MGQRFITKKVQKVFVHTYIQENNKVKDSIVMNDEEKIIKAEEILTQTMSNEKNIKRVKKEKGLIERTESSKIVITEDNRQVLND